MINRKSDMHVHLYGMYCCVILCVILLVYMNKFEGTNQFHSNFTEGLRIAKYMSSFNL